MPSSTIWVRGPSSRPGTLAGPTFAHTATGLPGGLVLIAGGQSDPDTYLASAALYDPDAEQFSVIRPMRTPCNHTATPLPGGRVLLAGGYSTGGVVTPMAELYIPGNKSASRRRGTWSALADHVAVLMADGRVLLAGGVGEHGITLDTAEIDDPRARHLHGDRFHGPGAPRPQRRSACVTAASSSWVVSWAAAIPKAPRPPVPSSM